ncbi:MAG TPA: hypothetical protein VII94_00250 [Candidatus Saccharimonadales bacterium]
MSNKELADLIAEHTYYCQEQYQPYKLTHLTSEKALEFQDRMCQSLTHFGMWLDTVKSRATKNNKSIKEEKDE